MKKKILSLLIIFCLVIPTALSLTACVHNHTASSDWYCDETYHWNRCLDSDCTEQLNKAKHVFKKQVIPATIDSTGSETEICTCGYIQSIKTLPQEIPTNNDMLATLNTSAKKNIYTHIKNERTSELEEYLFGEFATANTTEHMAKIGNEMVVYTVNNTDQLPAGYLTSEYITSAEYIVNNSAKNYCYSFNETFSVGTNGSSSQLELHSAEEVGVNFMGNYFTDSLQSSFDFAYYCANEDAVIQYFAQQVYDILKSLEMFGCYGSLNLEDVNVSVSGTYKNQQYNLVIEVLADSITYNDQNQLSLFKVNKVASTINATYTKDSVESLSSSITYEVVDTNATLDTSDDSSSTITDTSIYTFSTTTGAEHISKIKNLVAQYTGTYDVHQENICIYLNGQEYMVESINYGSSINSKINSIINNFEQQLGNSARVSAYLNEENTIVYNKYRTTLVDDYFGTTVYIVVTPINPTQSLLFIEYNTNNQDEYIQADGIKLVVVDNCEYTIDTTYNSATYDSTIYVNGNQLESNKFTVEGGKTYFIECERYLAEE